MGITGLWDVLGEGEIWHIADYAAVHFKQHGRPLRIAVDEATWRFTNLTPQQIERIRQGEPAANPQEKVILWRILRQWRLNIQFLFVTDGMKKPWKAGRHKTGPGGGKMDEQCIKLLHQLFDLMKVHYHRAPGEGEAEAARLQQLGVVDAVWSDDCDAFMFGCTTLIKQHKVAGKRVEDHIRVYKASTIMEKFDMDAASFVLFALLTGGDYDEQGLRGCGPKLAKEMAKRSRGLAGEVTRIAKGDLPKWQARLSEELRAEGKWVEIPPDFPKWKALEGYRNPSISTDEQCFNLRALRRGWDLPIDQPKLRIELRHRFNFSTREYLKHVAPAFLAQKLARTTTHGEREANTIFGVVLKPVRQKKNADPDAPAKSEVRILCSPAELVEVELGEQPLGEDWSKFAGKDGTPYNPTEKIECYILDVLLRHGLPQSVLDTPFEPPKRKSKSGAAMTDSQDTPPSSAHQSAPGASHPSAVPQSNAVPKKRGRPTKELADESKPRKKKQKPEQVAEEPPTPPRPKFKRLNLPDFGKPKAEIVDLSDDEENKPPFESSKVTSMGAVLPGKRSQAPPAPQSSQPAAAGPNFISKLRDLQVPQRFAHPSEYCRPEIPSQRESSGQQLDGMTQSRIPAAAMENSLVPGESIAPATLRELRLSALMQKNSPTRVSSPQGSAKFGESTAVTSKPPTHMEIIDLT